MMGGEEGLQKKDRGHLGYNKNVILNPLVFNVHAYQFPYYYEFPFNLLYYLCLSPFKIIDSEGIVLKTHPVQKVSCCLIHLFLWVFSILSIYGCVVDSGRMNPGTIYKIFNYVLWTSNVYILTYQTWFQQRCVRDVFGIRKQEGRDLLGHLIPYGVVVVLILMITPSYFSIGWDLTRFHWYENLETNVLYLTRDTTVGLSLNVSRIFEGSTGETVLVLCSILYTTIKDTSGFILFSQFIVSGIAVYEIAESLESQRVLCPDSRTIMSQLGLYAQAKRAIEVINGICGAPLAVAFISCISFTSMRIVTILDGRDWGHATVIVLFLIVSVPVFVLGAEAHAKVVSFENYLRQYRLFNGDSIPGSLDCCGGCWVPVAVYIESVPGSKGLAAGGFFTLTYSVLGQAVTVFLTYVIINVQFETGK